MAEDLIRWMQALFLPAAGVNQRAAWHPSADVYRTATGWLVKFDLAGVRPEDVTLEVHGSRLTVRGSRRDWSLEEGCRQQHMEIAYSCFERSITLPAELEEAQLTTEYRYGLLLVHVQEE
jgi:HSP20 family protein